MCLLVCSARVVQHVVINACVAERTHDAAEEHLKTKANKWKAVVEEELKDKGEK